MDPERLIQDGDDLERAMLRAGVDDGPSASVRNNVAAALNIGGGMSLGILKWIGGALLALAAIGAGLHFVRGPAPATAASSPDVVNSRELPPPVPITMDPLPIPLATADPVPSHSTVRTAPKSAPPVKAKRMASSNLAAETALVSEARKALLDGQPESALRTLDAYDAQFPSGILVPEATVVRIETLERTGDDAGAKKLGSAFLRQHPGSPLAARVRTLTNL